MALRPILRFPDARLRLAAAQVDRFDDGLRILVADLLETMRAAPGIGITAAHIGVSQRVVVLELDRAGPVRVYVNPEIVWSSSDTVSHPEGSVSMPGVTDAVERPARIRVRYRDLDGASHEDEADGLLAVCLQHEIDQLDGMFWLQRLSRLRRDRLVRRFEKMARTATTPT
ncbi:MAG TPA: peptide deformylase [Vineibacter sp.]|nr:peptide deformylase [Vineibacter sp.]